MRDRSPFDDRGRSTNRPGAGHASLRGAGRVATASIDRIIASPASYGAAFVMALTIGSVWANALFLQDVRHPAPLFGNWREARAEAPAAPSPRAAPSRSEKSVALPRPQPETVPAREAGALPAIDTMLVSEIQQALSARGLYSGKIDGIPGPQTDTAIRKFQSSAGLVPTGVASPDLLARLQLAPSRTESTQSIKKVSSISAIVNDPAVVKAVQTVLQDIGYGPLEADGILGDQTNAAIRRFERDNGLQMSGRIDAGFLRKLEDVVGRRVN
ncbi:MAG: peptidoglycan-binding protein [Hyphomicrobiales bacterium]|nr:peptidoglycan-binding protein [Hyphomicrobiales bacterium]